MKAGDPEGSSLFQMVAHKSEPFMPPKSPKVADTSIVMLEKWIKEGLLETADGKALALNKPTTDIALGTVRRGKPDGPPPMPEKPLPLDPLVVTLKGNAVIGLAASPWAPLLAVGGQKQIVLYNTDTMEYLGVIPFPDGFPTVLKFSRNGGFLLAGVGAGAKMALPLYSTSRPDKKSLPLAKNLTLFSLLISAPIKLKLLLVALVKSFVFIPPSMANCFTKSKTY